MIILGISSGHDSNICVLKDGQILIHVEKERITRKRYDGGSMEDLLPGLLAQVGISVEDVDLVATSIPVWNHIPRTGRVIGGDYSTADGYGEGIIELCGRQIPAIQIAHHLGHAAYAFFLSPFDSADILTLDAGGNFTFGLLCSGRENSIQVRVDLSEHRIGILWCAIAMRLFGDMFAAGKVMGLAPYGTPLLQHEIWMAFGKNTRDGVKAIHLSFPDWDRVPEFPGLPKSETAGPINQLACDAAASVQAITNEIVLSILYTYGPSVTSRNICIGGGLALNCVMNERIRQNGGFKQVFIGPASNDAGLSVGFALYVWHCVLGNKDRIETNSSAYLGCDFDEAEIRKTALIATNEGFYVKRFQNANSSYEAIVNLLKDRQVVGICFGKSESGPRALGHRSILADPRDFAMKDHINKRVKFREHFRPFAPAVMAEFVKEFFSFDAESPYMSFAPAATDYGRKTMPAIVHVDGSSRLQTVDKKSSPELWEILRIFRDETGVSGLLNTSLNTCGNPLCNGPYDAMETLMQSHLDGLLICDTLITRRRLF